MISRFFNLFESSKVVLINMKEFLTMSAKLGLLAAATLGLLKMKVF